MSYPTYARLDVNYYGDSFNTFTENPNSSSPDYTKLNFNLGLDLNENSKLQLSVVNLTHERTEAYVYAVNDEIFEGIETIITEPRQLSIFYI